MRGNISPAVAQILANPDARRQLRRLLITGQSGSVVLGDQSYNIEVGPPDTVVGAPSHDAQQTGAAPASK
jgi:hypothetical protein